MKNNYPEIEFRIDKKAELEVALYFLAKQSYDKFIEKYPHLKKAKEMSKEEASKFLEKEIDLIYGEKEEFLERRKEEIIKKWNKVKGKFFFEAEKIFDHKWPKGKYIANISVFGMFRLTPGTKKFSISSEDYGGNPPTYGKTNYTIIHEMMHILFEDFYKKYFRDKLSLQKYYDFMEIVNTIVLNLDIFKKITGWITYPYPQHKEMYEHLEKIYEKSKNMKEFCEEGINYMD